MANTTDIESRATLDMLFKISKELTSDLDLRNVLARALTHACTALGAERASIIVLDEKGQPMDAAIVVGSTLIPNSGPKLRSLIRKGLAGWVLRSGLPALVSDTKADPRWLARPDDSPGETGSKSAMCVPILTRDRPVGVFTIVHPTPNYFTPSHLSLLVSIADQAGSAIYNARLHGQMQQLQRRYRQLFDDSLDLIFISDREGNLREMNHRAAALIPHRGRALTSLKIPSLLNLDPKWLAEQEEDLRRNVTLQQNGFFSVKGREDFPVEFYLRPVSIDGGDNLQWIVRNITERVALDNMREILSECIVHDLRAPLSNIKSSMDLLGLSLPPADEENQEILAVASRSSERMLTLINSLLDVNRLTAGHSLTHLEQFDLGEVAEEAVTILRSSIHDKEQNLAFSVTKPLPPVKGDRDMLLRVFINLLDNAVKFTPSGGDLALSVMPGGKGIQCLCEDSGPGIPREEWPAVFDRYYRVGGNHRRSGYGLGLAFCRLALEAHGGDILVQSSPLGGSQFIFSIPGIESPAA